MNNEYKMQAEVGKFEGKLILAIATGDPTKVAGLVEREILSGSNEQEFGVYMAALDELGAIQRQPIPDNMDEEILKEAGEFTNNLKNTLKDPISALQLGAAAMAVVPTLAYGAKYLMGKASNRRLRSKVIKSDPLFTKNKKESSRYFNMIMNYAPALKKSPIIVGNLMKSWLNTGPEFITHAHVDQLLSLQERFNRTSTINDVAKATEIARNISLPLGEISRVMLTRSQMSASNAQALDKRMHDHNIMTERNTYDTAKQRRDFDHKEKVEGIKHRNKKRQMDYKP